MLRGNGPVTLRCGEKLLDFSTPLVMGIINVTPDSFYPPSRVSHEDPKLIDFAGKMIEDGASILDIGGISSRPGAEEIELEVELNRVIPAIEKLKKNFPDILISIDTYRSRVAQEGIKAGVTIINDISGGELDIEMIEVVSKAPVTYVLMHMRGHPGNMQSMTDYKDLIGDLTQYFVEKIRTLAKAGITDIILDPGFGFAKTIRQNYQVINHLDVFHMLGHPLMVGISRKSTLSQTIGRSMEETLEAASAFHMASLLKGANILRVHDVKAARDVIAVYQQLTSMQNP